MIRVGVIGAAGRMGQNVVAAVEDAEDLILTAAVDPMISSIEIHDRVVTSTTVAALPAGAADVLVDFSIAAAAEEHVAEAIGRGFHVVVGTTVTERSAPPPAGATKAFQPDNMLSERTTVAVRFRCTTSTSPPLG